MTTFYQKIHQKVKQYVSAMHKCWILPKTTSVDKQMPMANHSSGERS